MRHGRLFTLIVLGAFYACLSQPASVGVVTDAGLIEKEIFFEKQVLGDVCSISPAKSNTDHPTELFVGGRRGAAWLTLDGCLQSFIPFDRPVGTVLPIDVEGDGVYEFMNRGGLAAGLPLGSSGSYSLELPY